MEIDPLEELPFHQLPIHHHKYHQSMDTGGEPSSDASSSSSSTEVTLNYVIIGMATGCVVMVTLLAVVVLRCYHNWKWARYQRQKDEEDTASTKATIRISHSLPDLTQDISKHEYIQELKDKKVLRQTTLPTVPSRLQSFHRQLSHRLETASVDPAVVALERSRRRGTEDSIGLIQPELYKNELIRQSSSDSSTGESEPVGKLQFSLKYDRELETLILKVLQAMDLPAKDMSGSSDPYIKIYLLPDRKKKHQTKVHRRNLNPAFNETFLFHVPYEDLRDRYLQFSVYDFDRFSRHDLIGQVILKSMLDSSDLMDEIDYTMDILSLPKDKLDLGELMVSLCYLPTAGRLTVTIIKGRNLRAMDITGSSDPYTKVYLMCQGKKIRKRKTSVRKSCLFPVWNESLVFDVPSQNIQDVQLVFKVVDYDRVGPNEQLGCATTGSQCSGTGREHWLEMLDNPRRPVAQWYTLIETLPPNTIISTSTNTTNTHEDSSNINSPPDSPLFNKNKSPRTRHISLGCLHGQR